MTRRTTLLAVCLALLAAGAAGGPGKNRPKPTVTLARSWDAAVEEARLLNLPLVVHSHGFY